MPGLDGSMVGQSSSFATPLSGGVKDRRSGRSAQSMRDLPTGEVGSTEATGRLGNGLSVGLG